MVYLRFNERQDTNQQQELQDLIDNIDKKWTSLHSNVNAYRDLLAKTTQLLKLMEEVEEWITYRMQIIYKCNTKEHNLNVEHLIKNVEDVKQFNDANIEKMRRLAVEIYGYLNFFCFLNDFLITHLKKIGEKDGPNRIKHVVTKSINLLNSFIELKENSNKRTSQIYHESPAVDSECGPDFLKKLESTIVPTGSKHLYECIVNEAPNLEIKWFKNGVEIENTLDSLIQYDTKTGLCSLTINKVNTSDNALFSCKASNRFGLAETSAHLKVKELVKSKGSAPLIVSPLESVQLNADSTYTLECIISGEPEPNVVWYKDSIEIDSLPEPLKSSYKQSKFINVRQLTISNADSELQSGAYTCKAKNEFGEADCSCGVLIRSKKNY